MSVGPPNLRAQTHNPTSNLNSSTTSLGKMTKRDKITELHHETWQRRATASPYAYAAPPPRGLVKGSTPGLNSTLSADGTESVPTEALFSVGHATRGTRLRARRANGRDIGGRDSGGSGACGLGEHRCSHRREFCGGRRRSGCWCRSRPWRWCQPWPWRFRRELCQLCWLGCCAATVAATPSAASATAASSAGSSPCRQFPHALLCAAAEPQPAAATTARSTSRFPATASRAI